MGLRPKPRKFLVRTCLDFFATFLKKGSKKTFIARIFYGALPQTPQAFEKA